jgi:hypothetical protein
VSGLVNTNRGRSCTPTYQAPIAGYNNFCEVTNIPNSTTLFQPILSNSHGVTGGIVHGPYNNATTDFDGIGSCGIWFTGQQNFNNWNWYLTGKGIPGQTVTIKAWKSGNVVDSWTRTANASGIFVKTWASGSKWNGAVIMDHNWQLVSNGYKTGKCKP